MTRNILAYFKKEEDAQQVASKLKAMRVKDLSVDRFDGLPSGDEPAGDNIPLAGRMESAANMVLDTSATQPERALLAMNPMVYSLSDEAEGPLIRSRDILLTAIVEEAVYDRAVRLIEAAGGRV